MNALVLGVGMVPFKKPGENEPYTLMAAKAARAALEDAGVAYADVSEAYAGYCLADSCAGERALYEVGITGIPIFNVNNNCASGSSAIFLARRAIEAGGAECVLAVGFEDMPKRPGATPFADKPSPIDFHTATVEQAHGKSEAPIALQLFGGAGRAYRERYGTKAETFAAISVKARRHAADNEFAVFRKPLSVEEVLASPMIYEPLTRFMCSPMTCGAAAAVICSEAFARKHDARRAVAILAQSMNSDLPGTFDGPDCEKIVGVEMTRVAARDVYERAGIGPADLDLVELHDCFTTNEILSYEALGLCGAGEAEKFVREKDNTYGGKVVTNPSGGLLAKGHPIGATGIAQAVELVTQLRGAAGKRQVEGARLALAHNIGLGGACVVTLYGRS